jgi:hypothetical protein
MDIQNRLKELKELHAKGLISGGVYEQQQQEALAGGGSSGSTLHVSLPPRGLRTVWRVVAGVLIVLAGIWAVYSLSDRDSKDSISQFASQTGIGKQVIPWSDRADTAARKLVALNKDKLAAAIQGITHPTGSTPSMSNVQVSKLPDRLLVEMSVTWKGGITRSDYTTRVLWEIGERAHLRAHVTFDSAVAGVAPKNAQELNDYFLSEVYPTFVSDMGGG